MTGKQTQKASGSARLRRSREGVLTGVHRGLDGGMCVAEQAGAMFPKIDLRVQLPAEVAEYYKVRVCAWPPHDLQLALYSSGLVVGCVDSPPTPPPPARVASA